MILHDVSLYEQPGTWNIQVRNDRIQKISAHASDFPGKGEDIHLYLQGALALPGFINAHDHLDFNLFPQLGSGFYKSYREWGPRVRGENREVIEAILKIPEQLRIKWGLYKNLLNGFTTVVSHGKKWPIDEDLVNVVQHVQSLHSVGFEKHWKWKLNNPLKFKTPVVIHAGEGIDERSSGEIDELIRSNYLKRKLIAVHGVAMNHRQAPGFEGLIWCPSSNIFLLNKTAQIDQLKSRTRIAFGTDSTLTAPWNAWEHFRLALKTGMAIESELIKMLTVNAANLFGLRDRGKIAEGYKADLILVKNKTIFNNEPGSILLSMKEGDIKLADDKLLPPGTGIQLNKIKIEGQLKWVKGELLPLINEIKNFKAGTILEKGTVNIG